MQRSPQMLNPPRDIIQWDLSFFVLCTTNPPSRAGLPLKTPRFFRYEPSILSSFILPPSIDNAQLRITHFRKFCYRETGDMGREKGAEGARIEGTCREARSSSHCFFFRYRRAFVGNLYFFIRNHDAI